MNDEQIVVPSDWKEVPLSSIEGVCMVVGAADTGKTTLTHWLVERLEKAGRTVGVLDGDPGQSSLGLPGTMTFRDPEGETISWFVGSNSPRGSMLPVVVGARRLIDTVPDKAVVLYDTSGLIDKSAGGFHLKQSKIDLLKPDVVLALERTEELEPLLEPLRRRTTVDLYELSVPERVDTRDQEQRSRYRRQRYRQYFKDASELSISWNDKAVCPEPDFGRDRLVAFCNVQSFVSQLGIVVSYQQSENRIETLTPLQPENDAREIRVGNLKIDPETYTDKPVQF